VLFWGFLLEENSESRIEAKGKRRNVSFKKSKLSNIVKFEYEYISNILILIPCYKATGRYRPILRMLVFGVLPSGLAKKTTSIMD
jgi:hypothetical protein